MSRFAHELTGRQRYRVEKRMFRQSLVILQVEWQGFVPEYTPVSIEGDIEKYWRDARPEDITLKEAAHD